MSRNDADLRKDDVAARKHARSEFVRPVMLEAGAGTGKTATLVARVLVWALGEGWDTKSELLGHPEHDRIAAAVLDGIVAITFTEKAAVEMAERLTKAVRLVIGQEPVIGIDADDLPETVVAASRARSLLSVMDRLHVETIHAFCRRVLAENALPAGLHPDFDLDPDGSKTAEVVRETVEEWATSAFNDIMDSDAAPLLLAGFGLEEIESTTAVLVQEGVPLSFLESDPYDNPSCVAAGLGIAESIRELLGFVQEPFQSLKERNSATQDCLGSLADMAHELEQATDAEATAQAVAAFDLSTTHKRLKEWTKDGPNKGQTKALAQAEADPSLLRPLAAALVPRLKAVAAWNPELLRPAFRVLSTLVRDVRTRLNHLGILGFGDLLRECRNLLAGNETAADRLRNSIDQLLVDEVQDTDPLQYDIVRSLAFGGERKPGLFVVGDPKQTIYGFRQADLGAYQDFIRELEERGGSKRILRVNFRSDLPVLDEVERLMTPVMTFSEGLQPDFERLLCKEGRESERFSDESGRCAVEHWNSWARRPAPTGATSRLGARTTAGRAREIEALAIAADIAAQHKERGAAFSDFAVLFKATTQQEVYLSVFRDAGIPYQVEKDKQFFRRREVIDATSALLTVLDPTDQVSTLGWLRSAVVGMPDAAILPLWLRGLPGLIARLGPGDSEALTEAEAAVTAVAEEGLPDMSSAQGLPRWPEMLRHALKTLSRLRRSAARDAIDTFLHAFRTTWDHESQEGARFLGSHRVANLQRFFDRSLEILARPDTTRTEALRRIRADIVDQADMEEASPGDDTTDAVRVMSIHKSKGLDFKQVYLAALHQAPGGGFGSDTVLHRGTSWGARLLGAETPGFAALAEHREQVSAAENVRALYVAATRAENRVVFCGSWPDDEKASPAPDACRSLMDLVTCREGALRQWQQLSDDTGPERPAAKTATDVRWFMPDYEALESSVGTIDSADARKRRPAPASGVIAGRKDRMAALPESPFLPASSLLPEAAGAWKLSIIKPSGRPAPPQLPDADPDTAHLVGTAVHQVMEELPLDGAMSSYFTKTDEELHRLLPAEADEETVETLRRFIHELEESPLVARLRDIGANVLGREIPLLVEMGGVAVTGSCDLLYEDPQDGTRVVVDFKTDLVRDEAQALEKARSYAGQGEAYTRAVRQAFQSEENPRFELWFLSADLIVSFSL